MTKRSWTITKRALWFFAGVLATAGLTLWLSTPPSVTPESHRYGLADNWQKLAAPIIAANPPFQLTDDQGNPVVQDNARANVRLWDAVLRARNGQHLTNTPQQVGDCVSWGVKNAVWLLQYQPRPDGVDISPHEPFAPFYYGYGRVTIGRNQLRGDGMVGAWGAQSAQAGTLFADDNGVPAYSGAIARQWGSQGVPRAFLDVARARRVKAIASVKTALQARDALCNGYPVTVASMFGTTDIRPRDGRMVARRNTQWAHQMCCIAYDGSGPVAYFYFLNSWGESAHPQPLQGEPPGGFWVTIDDMQWVCSTGDCWALSDLDGFKARELNFNVFGALGSKQPVRVDADAIKTTLAF